MKRLLAASILACSLLAARANAATIVSQPDATIPIAGTEVVLAAGLDRQTPSQNGLAALVAESILRTPVGPSALPLRGALAADGAAISYEVDPRGVRFYLEGLASSYPAALQLFASALAKPSFTAATLRSARAHLDAKNAREQQIPLTVGVEMLNRSFYRNSDAGLPPLGLPETLARLGPAAAAGFFAAHYRRGDAVISTVGDIAAIPSAIYAHLLDGLRPGISSRVSVVQPKLKVTSQQLIARRDVPVPWLVAQYPAPALRSKDFGPMLVLAAFMQRTLADISQIPSVATLSNQQRGIGALYNFDTSPANLVLYVDGGQSDPSRTFATALTVVNVLGHAKLSGDLTEMKAFAAGQFLQGAQTLQQRAWLGAVFASEHLPGDYDTWVRRAVEATTAADLQRVAGRYLGVPTIALVLPRAQPSP